MAVIAYCVILGLIFLGLVYLIVTDQQEEQRHRERMRTSRKASRGAVREAEDKFYTRLREELRKQD